MKIKLELLTKILIIVLILQIIVSFFLVAKLVNSNESQSNADDPYELLDLKIDLIRLNEIAPKEFVEMELPQSDKPNDFKTYMDYKYITNTSSKQYELQQNATTNEYGLRMYNGVYMVALGSYYGEVGDYFIITLEDSSEILCIKADEKNSNDSNANEMCHFSDTKIHLVEFIVDTNNLDSIVRVMGNISFVDGFSGNITKIERLE